MFILTQTKNINILQSIKRALEHFAALPRFHRSPSGTHLASERTSKS